MICPSCRTDNDDTADNCFQCGVGLFALTQGAVLAARYEILRPLGRGGMGMVYRALDRELDEQVAIKLLRADIARAPEMARRFRSEIKLARRVRHRNVCAIHEYGQDGHLRFIVMELVPGVDLRSVLRRDGPPPADRVYDIGLEVATGLQAIHDVGIVHRDLKTPNIMIDARGDVRLMDFGIAKSIDADASTGGTATGHIVGTPEYMSPEQARAQAVDARSDLYALGIVLFELFTGDVPFRGDTPVATLFKQVQDPPPLEGPRASRIPPAARPILRRALAKTPDERFASAREMGEALRLARLEGAGTARVAGIVPVPTPPPLPKTRADTWVSVPPPPPRWTRRVVISTLVAAGVVVAYVTFRPSSPGETQPSPVTASVTASTLAATDPPPRPSVVPVRHSETAAPSPARTEAPLRDAVRAVARPKPASFRPEPVRPAPTALPTTPPPGELALVVLPWAQVSVDGAAIGTTPLRKPIVLAAGEHTLVFTNPGYHPLEKRVTIASEKKTRLEVDLAAEAEPRAKDAATR